MFAPLGPIGLLLTLFHEKAVAVSKGFVLHCHGWPNVNMLQCPLKELKPTLTRIATNARIISCTNQRKTSTMLHEIIQKATNVSLKSRTHDEQGIIKMVQQGATWDKEHTARSGYTEGTQCDHCGEQGADFAHVAWRRPALHDI